MKVNLLGPLEVADDAGNLVPLPRSQARILTLLAISANRIVSVDRLSEDLWEGGPPKTAATTLRAHVSRLRDSLGDHGRIATVGSGYLLRLEPGESDIAEFDHLLSEARARAADDDHLMASQTFTSALDLFRGPPLIDVADMPLARAEAGRIEEARITANEERIESEIAAGNHAAVLAELEMFCGVHPLRERLWAARMIALYRSGRQAESLRAFQALRQHLADELGIDPTPELCDLETAILNQDPSLSTPILTPSRASSYSTMPSGVVTFMLTDIEGSTQAWDDDPEAMAVALKWHDLLIEETVLRSGGVLIKSKGEGDATLAVFQRASAATACAVDLQRRFGTERTATFLGLRVRIALHSGEAYERNGDYFGPAVNRAARLRSLAQGGQIILSAATAELVHDRLPEECRLVELGTHELRGMRRPEQVLALVGRGLDEDHGLTPVNTAHPALLAPFPPALAMASRSPLIGRETPSAVLRDLVGRSVDGPTLAFISGDPGIGKTSLISHFASHMRDKGALVLYGRCDEDAGLAYQPFVEAIGSYIAQLTRDQLRDRFREEGPDLVRLLPELRRQLPDGMELDLADPETERHLMFEAVRQTVDAMSHRQATLIVLDDLHWATNPTVLLLRHLVRSGSPNLTVVVTYRDGEVGPDHPLTNVLTDLRRSTAVEELRLSGLDQPEVVSLLESMSGETLNASGHAVSERLMAETGGNPLFIRELLRHLVDIGVLHRDEGGHWTLTVEPGSLSLPDGVSEVVLYRVRRLSESARDVVLLASVFGQRFNITDLLGAADNEEQSGSVEAIDEVLGAGLLFELGDECVFPHALIRNALYASMSKVRQTRLHLRVAESIQQRWGERADPVVVAHHFAECVSLVGAEISCDWILRAADSQLGRLAFEEARSSLERGLEFLEGEAVDDHQRLALTYYGLARADLALGEFDRYKELAARAAEEAERAGVDNVFADASILLARVTTTGLPDPVTVSLCERALARVDPNDRSRRAQLLSALAFLKVVCDGSGTEANDLVDQAIELARSDTPHEVLHRALYVKCITLTALATASSCFDVANELYRRAASCNDIAGRGYALLIRTPLHLRLWDEPGFHRDLEELQELAETNKDWYLRAVVLQYRSAYASMKGSFSESNDFAAQMLEISNAWDFSAAFNGILLVQFWHQGTLADLIPVLEDLSQAPGFVIARVGLALALAESGRHSEAADFVSDLGKNNFVAVPRHNLWVGTICMLTEVCLELGDTIMAAKLVELLKERRGELITLSYGTGFLSSVDRLLGALYLLLGDRALAGEFLESAVAHERDLGARPMLCRSLFWYSRLTREDDPERSIALAEECLMLARDLGMNGVERNVVELHPALIAESSKTRSSGQ